MSAHPVSPRLAALAESLTLAVDVKAQERVAAGEDIVNFGAGQPDFPTPPAICEAAARAVADGATRYTPPGGTRELRDEAARMFRELDGIPATGATTVVTTGAKYALFDALAVLLAPGDEVLLPVPYWVTYPEQVKLLDGVPVPVTPADGLKITPDDLERHRGPRTRVLMLNSPNNPSGCVYSRDEIANLAAWCLRHDVWILSDEIYNRLIYDGRGTASPASLSDEIAARTLTVNGVSKSHCMTGWRIGFLTGPASVIPSVIKFQGQTTGNPAAVSQAGALAALRSPMSSIDTMRDTYQRRRDILMRELAGVPGLELDPPEGAFYGFPRVAEACRAVGGSLALAEALVGDGVAVVPGIGFGVEDHVRISFVVSDDRLVEGLTRFRESVTRLTGAGAES